MIEGGMPSEVFDDQEVEYLYISDVLKEFARTLQDYQPIKDIPENISLYEYLEQLTSVVNQLFRFNNAGVGVATILKQAEPLVTVNKLPEPGYTWWMDEFEHDCKLPTIITAFLIQAIADDKGWPLSVECLEMHGNPSHAVIGVKVIEPGEGQAGLPLSYRSGKIYTIDYEATVRGSFSRVIPQDDDSFDEKYGVTREPDLIKGIKLFDNAYERELAKVA